MCTIHIDNRYFFAHRIPGFRCMAGFHYVMNVGCLAIIEERHSSTESAAACQDLYSNAHLLNELTRKVEIEALANFIKLRGSNYCSN